MGRVKLIKSHQPYLSPVWSTIFVKGNFSVICALLFDYVFMSYSIIITLYETKLNLKKFRRLFEIVCSTPLSATATTTTTVIF